MRRLFPYLFSAKKIQFLSSSSYANVRALIENPIFNASSCSERPLVTNPGLDFLKLPPFDPRLFCSQILPSSLGQTSDCECEESEVKNKGLVSDVSKLYEIIVENCNGYDKMEKALDSVGVELSTDSVVEVLQRFHLEEKIAFRFFMWAGQHENYAHETKAYNLMMDILSSTKYKVKQFRIICDMLEYMKRNEKNVVPVDVLLLILRRYTEKVRDPKQGMKVLEEMIQIGHTPDNFTYNTAIDTFCKAGMVTEAAELFEFMRTKGSTISSPTAKTYAIMIVALVQNDRMEECFKLLRHMINSGCLPDVTTYKEFIEGMCLAGKVEQAYKFLEQMGNKGFPPDIVTYNCFLKVLCDNKKSDEALRLYERMIEVGCFPSVQTYNMLISMFFELGEPDGAFETWHEMDKRGCAQDTDTYCVMIDGLFDCNKVEEACFLLEEVVDRGLKLPYRKFDSFLMQLSVNGNLKAIHKLSEHMRKFYNPSMARRFAQNQKQISRSLRVK
ncbi:hypothetical protein Pint_16789 [Pistacia integerrima]|uniref:Uncharacterized protein n=1 Tax=Pistacia integerrima TaxID=434235 RepID=A0ACC0Z9S3_9ROSI|nr:hypothetical protein Pint_16789 [Pistacia integerrima]